MNTKKSMVSAVLAFLFLAVSSLRAGDLTVDDLTVLKNAEFCGNVIMNSSDAGLAFHYNFNTNSSTVIDVSGKGHTGTVYGATWTAQGYSNGAFDFDGVNNYVESVNNLGISGAASWTMSAWVKCGALATGWGNSIITIGELSDDGSLVSLGVGPASLSTVTLNFWSGDNTEFDCGVDLSVGFHLLVVTYDGTYVQAYADGVLKKTTLPSNLYISNAPMRIGGRPSTYDGLYFDGIIDDPKVYAKCLASNEVLQVYQMGRTTRSLPFTVDSMSSSNGISQTSAAATNYFMSNVGIGTNVPAAKLHVVGNVRVDGTFTGNGAGITNLQVSALPAQVVTNGAAAAFTSVSGNAAGLTALNGAAISAGTVSGTQLANGSVDVNKLNQGSVDTRYVKKSGDTMTGALVAPANGLVVGGSQLVTASGNVGIGTTAPRNKLDVVGGILADYGANNNKIGFQYLTGSDYYHGLSLDNTAARGIRIDAQSPDASGAIFFRTGTVATPAERMRITSAGYVGIGTTTPATYLHVQDPGGAIGSLMLGSGNIYGTTADQGGVVFDFYSTGAMYQDYKTTAAGKYIYMRCGSGAESCYARNWMTVDTSNGSVGIGGSATAPSAMLEINSGGGNAGNGIYIYNSSGNGSTLADFRSNWGDGNGGSLLNVRNYSGSGLFMDCNRNVGVGTTAPTAKLDVNGNARFGMGVKYVAPLGDLGMGSYTNGL